MKKLSEILLVDDNDADNFYHERVIKKLGCAERVVIKKDGQQALDYLTTEGEDGYPRPDIVFLDINMPVMNGWEFLDAYEKLDSSQRAHLTVVMLTTSVNPDDKEAALAIGSVATFKTKPLKRDALEEILATHFPDDA